MLMTAQRSASAAAGHNASKNPRAQQFHAALDQQRKKERLQVPHHGHGAGGIGGEPVLPGGRILLKSGKNLRASRNIEK